MRIAYLCKRQYMGKDVIVDRYARLYEIPFQLARLGHTVECFCLDYRNGTEAGSWQHEAGPGRLAWHSQTLREALPAYPWILRKRLRAFQPDLVIAASDIPHVALGAWMSKRLRRPFVADLYDNFEGFGQARIPGFVTLLRRAIRSADLVVTTSEPLRQFVNEQHPDNDNVVAMPSTIDKAVFHAGDKIACRASLGLPADALLVGTAGGLYRDKGIEALYAAWPLIADALPNVHLVLAGPHEAALPLPQGTRVHALGPLPHARVADLFRALDVGVICILDTPFGRYCFPQKAYEMLACRLPVVAANLGAMGHLLADTPECLYRVGDARDLASKLLHQLQVRRVPETPIDDWEQIIRALEPRLRALVTH
jgi:teichuronic acid biosynthesis glycosyltransferase TuaC